MVSSVRRTPASRRTPTRANATATTANPIPSLPTASPKPARPTT